MLNTMITYIQRHNLFTQTHKLIIGVSGGADSVVLLHLLKRLQQEYLWGIEMFVVHVNHGIRGTEADEDQLFVENLCKEWGVPFQSYTISVPELALVHKKSLEEMGREVRYKLFEKIRTEKKFDYILVAHHQNDQAETILMNLIRGSGTTGLIGMTPQNGRVLRPLLCVSRHQIITYCKENNLSYKTDSTNEEEQYLRNKIRKRVMPVLNECNPNLLQAFTQLSEILFYQEEYMEYETQKMIKAILLNKNDNKIEISRDLFVKSPIALQHRVIRQLIFMLLGHIKHISYQHIQIVQEFITKKETGKIIHLPRTLTVSIKYDMIQFYIGRISQDIKIAPVIIQKDQKIHIPNLNAELELHVLKNEIGNEDRLSSRWIVEFDGQVIKEPLQLRTRMPGDIFSPSKGRGTKKLKDYFIDLKIPREERERIPLVAQGSEILWIVGYDYNKKYKVTPNTEIVYRMIVQGEERHA